MNRAGSQTAAVVPGSCACPVHLIPWCPPGPELRVEVSLILWLHEALGEVLFLRDCGVLPLQRHPGRTVSRAAEGAGRLPSAVDAEGAGRLRSAVDRLSISCF